jgi:hypothetical protein
MLLPMHEISNKSHENNTSPHSGRPIRIVGGDRQSNGEASEDNDESRVEEGEAIDEDTGTAEGPAGVGERLAFDALKEDAADGDHIGGEESEEREGDDDVEAEGAAEIDEAEDGGYDGGYVDSVEGHVEFVVHLWGEVMSMGSIWRRHEGRLTRDMNLEPGRPLSREKANTSRDVVARAVMLPEKMRKKRMITSIRATPLEPVPVKRLRYGAAVLRAS